MPKSILNMVITDINECERYPNYCSGGSCKNTIGSFHCTCPAGFKLDPNTITCQGNMIIIQPKFRIKLL